MPAARECLQLHYYCCYAIACSASNTRPGPILALTSIVLVAGGIVLQFFIILSGINSLPLNLVYFLQADTTSIQGGNDRIRDPARWTYLAICGVDGTRNANCGPMGAAIPFDPARNFGTEQGVPEQFLTNRNKWYYLSRVSWALFLVALFLSVIGFFVSLLAICARLGGYMAGFFVLGAFFFQTVAAALMTYVSSSAQDAMQANRYLVHGQCKPATDSKPTVLKLASEDTPSVSPGLLSLLS